MVTAPAGTRKSPSGEESEESMKAWTRPDRLGVDSGDDLDFQEFVLLAPEGQAHQPVLAVEGMLGFGPLSLGQNASAAGGLWTNDLAAGTAGRDRNLGMVANALVLPGVVTSHKIKLAILFREPNGRGDGGAILAEGGEGEILLSG